MSNKTPNNKFNLTMAMYAIDPDHARRVKAEGVIPVLTALTRPLQVKQMFGGRPSVVTASFITPTGADLRRGGNAMDNVLTLSEIKGIMQKTLYNRYGFPVRDDEIDCLIEQIRKAPAEGTEQANQPDKE